ncbi:hypothetical protein RSAG8_13845, partial [Rhizoctonia solani AG-8 WAC10335]
MGVVGVEPTVLLPNLQSTKQGNEEQVRLVTVVGYSDTWHINYPCSVKYEAEEEWSSAMVVSSVRHPRIIHAPLALVRYRRDANELSLLHFNTTDAESKGWKRRPEVGWNSTALWSRNIVCAMDIMHRASRI